MLGIKTWHAMKCGMFKGVLIAEEADAGHAETEQEEPAACRFWGSHSVRPFTGAIQVTGGQNGDPVSCFESLLTFQNSL